MSHGNWDSFSYFLKKITIYSSQVIMKLSFLHNLVKLSSSSLEALFN